MKRSHEDVEKVSGFDKLWPSFVHQVVFFRSSFRDARPKSDEAQV